MLSYQSISHKVSTFFATIPGRLTGYLLLSWIYALASQIIIPLPFNFVPLSIQPLPLFLATWAFGWHAVTAYAFYLAQGALGLPFFSGMQGGLLRFFGPTGGYLIGFGLAMVMMAATRRVAGGKLWMLVQILAANVIIFSCGLLQLSFFVPAARLLSAGLFPFLIGDFLIKPALVWLVLAKRR